MTAAIPDDIMQAASEVFQTEIKAGQSGGVFVLERIARAILAERERCASVIESLEWFVQMSPDHIRGRKPEEYAAAIRNQTPDHSENSK